MQYKTRTRKQKTKKYTQPNTSRNNTIGAVSSTGQSWYLNFEKDVKAVDVEYFINEVLKSLDKRKKHFIAYDVSII